MNKVNYLTSVLRSKLRSIVAGPAVIPDCRRKSFKVGRFILDVINIFKSVIVISQIIRKSNAQFLQRKKVAIVLGGGISFNQIIKKTWKEYGGPSKPPSNQSSETRCRM